MADNLDAAHDAFNRMRQASESGTGCRLTAEMIQALSVSIIGQMWSEDDPRSKETGNGE